VSLKPIKKFSSDNKKSVKGIHEKLQVLETDFQSTKIQMEGLQGKTSTLDKSVSDIKCQFAKDKITKTEFRAEVDKLSQELDVLHGQQLYVDTLFRVNQPPLRSTRFTWRIDGFKELWEARKAVVSPKFYCLPHGHLCQLSCKFQKPDSKDMGLFFNLCRGKITPAADFKATILLTLMLNNGGTKPCTITLDEVEENRDDVFTLKDGRDLTTGFGPSTFLEESRYDEFVENDTCVIICTVTPTT